MKNSNMNNEKTLHIKRFATDKQLKVVEHCKHLLKTNGGLFDGFFYDEDGICIHGFIMKDNEINNVSKLTPDEKLFIK